MLKNSKYMWKTLWYTIFQIERLVRFAEKGKGGQKISGTGKQAMMDWRGGGITDRNFLYNVKKL